MSQKRSTKWCPRCKSQPGWERFSFLSVHRFLVHCKCGGVARKAYSSKGAIGRVRAAAWEAWLSGVERDLRCDDNWDRETRPRPGWVS